MITAVKFFLCILCFVFVAFAQASDEVPKLPEGWTLEEPRPSDNRVETLIEQGVIPQPLTPGRVNADTNNAPFVHSGSLVVPSTQTVVRPTAPTGPTAPVKP